MLRNVCMFSLCKCVCLSAPVGVRVCACACACVMCVRACIMYRVCSAQIQRVICKVSLVHQYRQYLFKKQQITLKDSNKLRICADACTSNMCVVCVCVRVHPARVCV